MTGSAPAAKVLLVHNRYQQAGGEDVVFEAEASLLADRGHTVTQLVLDNQTIADDRSPLASLRLAGSTIWSRRGAALVRAAVERARPDVVHFHNTFPQLSPAAYYAVKAAGIPVVQTLHNFRLVCPAATLFRDGHVCEDCLGRTVPWPAVAHACYRASRPASAATAAMLSIHGALRTWSRKVDLFIALTEFARDTFVRGGLPADRIVVKPNFLPTSANPDSHRRDGFLFVGRLTREKGIETMLRAWHDEELSMPLRVAGSGPMAEEVQQAAAVSPAVQALGVLPREAVLAQMRVAGALVFPSIWYEGFPMTLVEAFSCGLPVIASRLGAMAELIDDGRTGLLFTPGDPADLAAKVRWASDHPTHLARMGAAARDEYETKYTASINYQRLMEIYAVAIERSHGAH